MKTNTNTKKKILIVPAILLSVLFFNLSIGSDKADLVKPFFAASVSGKTCSVTACNYVSDSSVDEQIIQACVEEITKPDLIIEDAFIKPEDPTIDHNICLYATIKNIGTKAVESHDLTAWTYVNDKHASNTYYGKILDIGKTITKEIFCSKYGDNVWFVKGENTIKINIDPESINIVDELNEENNEKVLSFKIIESVPEAVCGNGICEENESPYSCKEDCTGWEEVFDTEKCTTWHAPNVFNYSPCGDTKIYNVVPGDSLRLSAYGDNCASCVCYHVNFDLYDHINGEWVKVKTVDEPDEKTGIRSIFNYIPKGDKIKVVGTSGCFHFNLYREKSVPEAVCGNSICEDGETLENCAKDCNIIYPSESDVGYCIASDGKKYPTTGEGAATWFLWNRCSKYKVYSVKSGKQINMKITGDSCSSCVCYSPSFIIYEYNDQTGEWVKTKEYVKPGYKGYSDDLLYTPKYSKMKVVASKCFYLKIYGETVEDESDWDVSIKFDKANKASFYPFSENEGETGKTYYSRLNESDNLYEEYVGGECCEYWSNSYYYNKYEEEQAKRAKGWYAERKKISDSKYKLLIRGIAWADCAYSGYGYAEGELNLNSDGNWKISEVVKCSVSGSNKGQETYCKTDEKSVRFAAGSTCGGCCACADSGSVNIEIIVEKGDSINNDPDNCLPDGTLIKLPNDPKIYVVRNCKKQWIETAEEFKNNGYKWSDVKDTSKEVINAYADYLEATANLLRAVGHNRIYRVINGKILWVPTVSAFNAQGLKWGDVQNINETDINNYPQAKLIKAKGDDRIFYVTNSGIKKHIINGEVFNSYNNKHSDVVEVSPEIISSFYTANLFKDQNGNKVYKIEGNEKRWIKSAEAFRRYNFNWNKIVPANNVELNAYIDGESIE
ncbi:MAG: hypothetical protein KAU07_02465 [Candidatus Andersenbacteria bacterium]|nr:hypothetical protein [Candidatus Andersenbacteria bacterium]